MITTKKAIATAVALSVAVASPLFLATTAFGIGNPVQSGVDAARAVDVPANLLGDGGVVTTAVNALLFVVGALSVIMLIWGGLRYIISGGNSGAVTAAKNTILYAIVGLVIALFAYAIVNFVIGSLTGSVSAGTNV